MTKSQMAPGQSATALGVNAVTLAARNPALSSEFYSQLGFSATADHGSFVAFNVPSVTTAGGPEFAVYEWGALAADAGVTADSSGFECFTLSALVGSAGEVDALLVRAGRAGGTILKPSKRAFWGGYSGYFADPDGHLWKVGTDKKPEKGHSAVSEDQGELPGPVLQAMPVTLGVADVKKTRDFYVSLGCEVAKDYGRFVSLKVGEHFEIGLYRLKALAKDAGVSPVGAGFHGFTFSHVVSSPDEVDMVLSAAVRAGAQPVFRTNEPGWGGYSRHFADPDGNLWKIVAPSTKVG